MVADHDMIDYVMLDHFHLLLSFHLFKVHALSE